MPLEMFSMSHHPQINPSINLTCVLFCFFSPPHTYTLPPLPRALPIPHTCPPHTSRLPSPYLPPAVPVPLTWPPHTSHLPSPYLLPALSIPRTLPFPDLQPSLCIPAAGCRDGAGDGGAAGGGGGSAAGAGEREERRTVRQEEAKDEAERAKGENKNLVCERRVRGRAGADRWMIVLEINGHGFA
ncbi:unnamed protein product [Closterium sp. NIES-53]